MNFEGLVDSIGSPQYINQSDQFIYKDIQYRKCPPPTNFDKAWIKMGIKDVSEMSYSFFPIQRVVI